jgi:hypothetical protein
MWITRQCKACGADLPRHSRYDKEFCDGTCRKTWHRRRDAIQKDYNRVMSGLSGIRLTGQRHNDLTDKAIQVLKELRAEVDYILLALGDKDTQQLTQMLNDYHNKRG